MKPNNFVELLESRAPIAELKAAFLELSDPDQIEVFSTADNIHSLDGLVKSLSIKLIYDLSIATGDLQLLVEALVERLPFELKIMVYNVSTNEFKLDEAKAAAIGEESLLFAYKHNKIFFVPEHDDAGVKTGIRFHKELDQKFLLSVIYQFIKDECPAIATRFGASAYAVEYRCRPDFATSDEFFAKLEYMSKIAGEATQVINLGLVATALVASLTACGQSAATAAAVDATLQAVATAQNVSAVDSAMADLSSNSSGAFDSSANLYFIQVSSTGVYSPYMSQISSLRFSSFASADSFRLLLLQRIKIRLTNMSTQVLPDMFASNADNIITNETNYAVTTNYR